ncbi:MAG TPA: hypothetical protein ENI95_00565 [Chloroflexi bacterium]|nr:hypothetical protein [Chloroflexota bacterium]
MPGPPENALYWGGQSEEYLSTFQRNQGQSNHCGAYAVGAALSLLRGGRTLDYRELAGSADRSTSLLWAALLGVPGLLFGPTRRLWPGGPITPRQQANLARWAARRRGFKVKAKVMRGTVDDLWRYLAQPGTVVLVTIGWDDDTRPRIAHPDDGKLKPFPPVGAIRILDRTVRYPFAAHVMALAAYDPSRTATAEGEEIATPWGFINSWRDGHEREKPGYGRLYWMPDADFRAAWEYSILIGSRYMVVIAA